MTNNNQDYDYSFFKNRHFAKFVITTIVLVILTFIASLIFNGKNITSRIISDYYFVVGIILLILSSLSRVIAWGIHKKSVLKPHQDNQRDTLIAKDKLKLLSKILAFIGSVYILISLAFLFIYF